MKRLRPYRVTLKHDHGVITITTFATSATRACSIVCTHEGAPDSAVIDVRLADD